MPLYEYQCPKCGRFELIQKFSDSPLLACPTCGSEVQKLLSAPAIQFKGTGWYITDYARKSDGAAKPDASKAETGKTEGSKTEGGNASPAPAGDAKTASTASTGSREGGNKT